MKNISKDSIIDKLKDDIQVLETLVNILKKGEEFEPPSMKILRLHLFPTKEINTCVGTITTTTILTDLHGVEKKPVIFKSNKILTTYCVNPEGRKIERISVIIDDSTKVSSKTYYDSDDDDPLDIDGWVLGGTSKYGLKTYFNMDDEKYSILQYPEDFMSSPLSLKNVAVVEEGRYNELCKHLIGRKRKRLNQSDVDNGINKKRKIN